MLPAFSSHRSCYFLVLLPFLTCLCFLVGSILDAFAFFSFLFCLPISLLLLVFLYLENVLLL